MFLLLSRSVSFEVGVDFKTLFVSSRLFCFLILKSIGLEGEKVGFGTSFTLFWNAKPFSLLLRSTNLGLGLGLGLGLDLDVAWLSWDFISFALVWDSRAFCLAIISLSFWLMDSVLLSVDKKKKKDTTFVSKPDVHTFKLYHFISEYINEIFPQLLVNPISMCLGINRNK